MSDKPMTLDQALKVLIACAEEKRRREFAFDANLYLKGIETDRTRKAHKKYVEINEAIDVVTKNKNKIIQLSLF